MKLTTLETVEAALIPLFGRPHQEIDLNWQYQAYKLLRAMMVGALSFEDNDPIPHVREILQQFDNREGQNSSVHRYLYGLRGHHLGCEITQWLHKETDKFLLLPILEVACILSNIHYYAAADNDDAWFLLKQSTAGARNPHHYHA